MAQPLRELKISVEREGKGLIQDIKIKTKRERHFYICERYINYCILPLNKASEIVYKQLDVTIILNSKTLNFKNTWITNNPKEFFLERAIKYSGYKTSTTHS